ncbi:MAG: hypothetical protein KDB02_12625 [Acidimicrobiales bacterium]|nr:hypothetical protein [Acidimicrobiales bacterium]
MPAETHQVWEPPDTGSVLEVLADLLAPDLALDAAAEVTLGSVGHADDLSLHHLWNVVADEMCERTIGDLGDEPDWTPEMLEDTTLVEVARWFQSIIASEGVGGVHGG